MSNLIDLHILTSAYDTEYRQWIQNGQVGSAPTEPSTGSLRTAYDPTLSDLRNVSDEIVYRPVKYKLLFGPNADNNRHVYKGHCAGHITLHHFTTRPVPRQCL